MTPSALRKHIKQYHIRQAFIATAARIIAAESPEAVTARRTAEESGYALATLYKYFRNLDELLWHARIRLIDETVAHFEGRLPGAIDNWDSLKDVFLSFLAYFMDRPKIFRFLYGYRLDPAFRPEGSSGDLGALGAKMAPVAAFLAKSAIAESAMAVAVYSLMGFLAVYMGGNDKPDPAEGEALAGHLCAVLRYAVENKEPKNA